MTKDLNETLNELPAEYRSVVERLKASREVEPRALNPFARVFARRAAWTRGLVAASIAAVLLVGGALVGRLLAHPDATTPLGPREYALANHPGTEALLELVRTQKPDGSWQNDFLTKRNALALRGCSDERMRLAYRKAVRNLRLRGLSESSVL